MNEHHEPPTHDDALVVPGVNERAFGQHLRRANAELSRRLDEKFGFEGVVGNSEPMREVVERLSRIAPTDATVLIQGPTGAGKSVLLRALAGPFRAQLEPIADQLAEYDAFVDAAAR